jgi:hypothetical protein
VLFYVSIVLFYSTIVLFYVTIVLQFQKDRLMGASAAMLEQGFNVFDFTVNELSEMVVHMLYAFELPLVMGISQTQVNQPSIIRWFCLLCTHKSITDRPHKPITVRTHKLVTDWLHT